MNIICRTLQHFGASNFPFPSDRRN